MTARSAAFAGVAFWEAGGLTSGLSLDIDQIRSAPAHGKCTAMATQSETLRLSQPEHESRDR